MKKRVVSWLLVMLMLASLLPTSVLAEMVDTVEQTAVEEPLAEDVTVLEERKPLCRALIQLCRQQEKSRHLRAFSRRGKTMRLSRMTAHIRLPWITGD